MQNWLQFSVLLSSGTKINFNSTNEEVLKVLDDEVDKLQFQMLSIFSVPGLTVSVLFSQILHSFPQKDVFLLNFRDRLIPKGFVNFFREQPTLNSGRLMKTVRLLGYLSQANNLLKEIQANTDKNGYVN